MLSDSMTSAWPLFENFQLTSQILIEPSSKMLLKTVQSGKIAPNSRSKSNWSEIIVTKNYPQDQSVFWTQIYMFFSTALFRCLYCKICLFILFPLHCFVAFIARYVCSYCFVAYVAKYVCSYCFVAYVAKYVCSYCFCCIVSLLMLQDVFVHIEIYQ